MLGEAATVWIDTQSWQVRSIGVKLRKEVADQMGANRSMLRAVSLEIPVRMIQSVGDTVLLSVPVDGLHHLLSSRGDEHREVPREAAAPDKGN